MFVRGETQGQTQDGEKQPKVVNPEKIDIDDEDDDDEDNADEAEEVDLPIEKKDIPSEVFGSLKKTDAQPEEENE